jgi:hypothetical protein
MLARSAIRAETRFSRCPGSGEDGSVQKSFVSRSKSDNQAHAFHLATTPDALRGVFQALNRREFTLNTLNCPICVLSNRTILTLSCRHPYLALDPEETRALNAAYHQRIHRDQSNLIPLDPEARSRNSVEKQS